MNKGKEQAIKAKIERLTIERQLLKEQKLVATKVERVGISQRLGQINSSLYRCRYYLLFGHSASHGQAMKKEANAPVYTDEDVVERWLNCLPIPRGRKQVIYDYCVDYSKKHPHTTPNFMFTFIYEYETKRHIRHNHD